jgi:ubiquitin carboxyl-terminal hydrolase MINDY-3/4
MLVGKAASNVHDGDKDVGDGFILKGIQKQSDIGFLTFFEHFGYFEVGPSLKQPRVPVWVICSESHYSVMFAPNIALAGPTAPPSFDLVYYDELSRQEDDIILTV